LTALDRARLVRVLAPHRRMESGAPACCVSCHLHGRDRGQANRGRARAAPSEVLSDLLCEVWV
jgi:hypothetical protein